MIKIPFFRRIIFKVLLLVVTVLSIALSVSFIITTKKTNAIIEKELVKDFTAAQHTTENFINLISQASQMWAKEIIYDYFIYKKIGDQDVMDLSDIINIHKAKISADSIILLDKNGIVLSQAGSVHKTGDSLLYYDVLKETLETKESATKIARENESFILYSSAIIEENYAIQGVILVGYFINDIFLENIKQSFVLNKNPC